MPYLQSIFASFWPIGSFDTFVWLKQMSSTFDNFFRVERVKFMTSHRLFMLAFISDREFRSPRLPISTKSWWAQTSNGRERDQDCFYSPIFSKPTIS